MHIVTIDLPERGVFGSTRIVAVAGPADFLGRRGSQYEQAEQSSDCCLFHCSLFLTPARQTLN
jgi:hypothetical protein